MHSDTGAILKFSGEHAFLSNFYVAPFRWRGWVFRTAEHAFQAAKMYHIIDPTIVQMQNYLEKIQAEEKPTKAKYHGKSVKIDVESWNSMRVQYMREIIHSKFYDVRELGGKLINTGATMLIEGNDWGDKFWGRCFENGKWVGMNTLGVILMEERGYWLHGTIREPERLES